MIQKKHMISALLFDLDNTLYSEATGLENGVSQRINHFIADFFGLSIPEAIRFRREHAKAYGTTLEWLMRDYGFQEPEKYFRTIHPENEADCLNPDMVLKLMLNKIPIPKAVLTNAPMEHAIRILDKLGITECFSGIYDIWFNNLIGKPNSDSYINVLEAAGFDREQTLFIDDLPKYVKGYVDIGGPAVLKDEMDRFADLPFRRLKTIYELDKVLDEFNSSYM
jgi:putative hydrolase of the HAD superfamily